MKKFILVIASFVVALIVVGAFWHLNVQKEHAFDYYQKEVVMEVQNYLFSYARTKIQ